jgi:hypothetical protein
MSLPPPCPWVVLKILQSCLNPIAAKTLLQKLGHFLLHAIGLRQRGDAVCERISYFDIFEVAEA